MKYWRTFLLGLQTQFQYRTNLLGWMIVSAIPAFVLINVWFAILGNKSSINGFSKGDFIVYYLFMAFGWYIVGGWYGQFLGEAIQRGEVNTSLLKPYSIVLERAFSEQAWKVVSIIIGLPILLIILFFLRDSIHLSLSFKEGLLLLLSLLLGGINFALVEAIIGVSGFWFVQMWPVSNLNYIAGLLFGGLSVPLVLMPQSLQVVASILPYKYQFYIPITLLLHKSTAPLLDISIQVLSICILFCIYKLLWQLGIRKFEAIGG